MRILPKVTHAACWCQKSLNCEHCCSQFRLFFMQLTVQVCTPWECLRHSIWLFILILYFCNKSNIYYMFISCFCLRGLRSQLVWIFDSQSLSSSMGWIYSQFVLVRSFLERKSSCPHARGWCSPRCLIEPLWTVWGEGVIMFDQRKCGKK